MSKLTEQERKALIAKAKEDMKNAPKLDPEAERTLLRKWREDDKSWHSGMFREK
jgi:hypothetical protein